MAQLDVYRTREGELLLDCQADLLSHFNTRFVIPLASPDEGPKPARKLNPLVVVDGEPMVLYTQFALSVPASELKDRVMSLADRRNEVMDALDMLLSGI